MTDQDMLYMHHTDEIPHAHFHECAKACGICS